MTQLQKTKEIEIKSLRERYLLMSNYMPTLHIPQKVQYSPYNGNEKWDAKWIDINNTPRYSFNCIAEVKVRLKSKKFGEYMIEKDKYDYLMNQTEFTQILYINFFEDGIVVWDLRQIPQPEWKDMTGQNNNSDNQSKIKYGADLNTKDAMTIIEQEIDLMVAYKTCEQIWLKRNNNK